MRAPEREMLRKRRLRDVATALAADQCMMDLARKWRTSRPYVSSWCRKYISDDCRRQLAENGHQRADQSGRKYDLVTRLELLALCQAAEWPMDKIAMALGVQRSNVSMFLKRHAPDGIEAAIADYRTEEAA